MTGRLNAVDARRERGDDLDQLANDAPEFTFRGPWFSTREAAAYVPCKSLNAFRMWRNRHGIIPRNNGSVAKADLDRVLKQRKPRRVMAAASLANLRRKVG